MSLLCSPLTKGMIRQVSIQSAGGLGHFVGDKSKEDIIASGIEFMKTLGCSDIEEMRRLDARVLRDENDKLGFMNGFNIYTDGYVLNHETDEYFLKDLIPHDVKIIIGCTADEGANGKKTQFGINMYERITELCKVLKKNDHQVYMYVFDQKQPGDDAGVPHSCDNRYQFGTLDGSWRPYTEKDYALSDTMQGYWANFAKKGDPNAKGLTKWEPFNENEKAMWLKADSCMMK